jgi:hypothetical protein
MVSEQALSSGFRMMGISCKLSAMIRPVFALADGFAVRFLLMHCQVGQREIVLAWFRMVRDHLCPP